MEKSNEKIIQIADLLEQIQAVEKTIQLHQTTSGDSFQIAQYEYRRNEFIHALQSTMQELNFSIEYIEKKAA
ncbi:MAG: hypothetical protein RLZZ292_3013 [Bacteroidota bacterium]|jgi:hypothetical protein